MCFLWWGQNRGCSVISKAVIGRRDAGPQLVHTQHERWMRNKLSSLKPLKCGCCLLARPSLAQTNWYVVQSDSQRCSENQMSSFVEHLEQCLVHSTTGVPRFIALRRRCIFLQSEGKSLHQWKYYDLLKVQMMVSIFQQYTIFQLRNVHTFFLDIMLLHLIDSNIV